MKQNKGIVFKRQEHILRQLKHNKIVYVNHLAETLSVAPITIRRDLQSFQDQGLVNRFHGGATIVAGVLTEDPTLEEKQDFYATLKESIAKKASSFVENGDTIFINSSSTALLMLKYLEDKRVVVITNNGKALNHERKSTTELVLTGGEVYHRKQSMVGDFATQSLMNIVASKAFIGVGGISAEQGVTTCVLQETAINKLMIERCNGNCYVLADHSKIGKQNNFLSGTITSVHTLITGKEANDEELERIRNKGVRIVTL